MEHFSLNCLLIKYAGKKKILDGIPFTKFYIMDQMIYSENFWICRKNSGNQTFLQSSKDLTLQLCLAGKGLKAYVIIST